MIRLMWGASAFGSGIFTMFASVVAETDQAGKLLFAGIIITFYGAYNMIKAIIE